jgi:hypothetical protein
MSRPGCGDRLRRKMSEYLRSTHRAAIADEADKLGSFLRPDEGCAYDQVPWHGERTCARVLTQPRTAHRD